jgi:hypothetical protein
MKSAIAELKFTPTLVIPGTEKHPATLSSGIIDVIGLSGVV